MVLTLMSQQPTTNRALHADNGRKDTKIKTGVCRQSGIVRMITSLFDSLYFDWRGRQRDHSVFRPDE